MTSAGLAGAGEAAIASMTALGRRLRRGVLGGCRQRGEDRERKNKQ